MIFFLSKDIILDRDPCYELNQVLVIHTSCRLWINAECIATDQRALMSDKKWTNKLREEVRYLA